jgi:hypothetical protein
MITFLLIACSFSFAHADGGDVCYKGEINAKTKKVYASYDEWAMDLEEWTEKEPPRPSMWHLYKAYSVYKEQLPTATKLKKDKVEHCYMGCMIAQATSQDTVRYVAWLKESRDLQDCSKSTHFEEADFIATLLGGQIGATATTPEECVDACQNPL